jgi:hypothetical protein
MQLSPSSGCLGPNIFSTLSQNCFGWHYSFEGFSSDQHTAAKLELRYLSLLTRLHAGFNSSMDTSRHQTASFLSSWYQEGKVAWA